MRDDDNYCCLDACCGPGSWCCQRANPHTHTSDGAVVPTSRPLIPAETTGDDRTAT